MGTPSTPEGQPYLWRAVVNEPPRNATVFLARHANFEAGALVMTTAISENGNPHEPADRLIIVPLPGTVIVLDYIDPYR